MRLCGCSSSSSSNIMYRLCVYYALQKRQGKGALVTPQTSASSFTSPQDKSSQPAPLYLLLLLLLCLCCAAFVD